MDTPATKARLLEIGGTGVAPERRSPEYIPRRLAPTNNLMAKLVVMIRSIRTIGRQRPRVLFPLLDPVAARSSARENARYGAVANAEWSGA
jgi:hypothetical protein